MIPPIITPFKQDENIDEEGLRIVVDYLIEQGVSGIFALGSSSEFAYMDLEERMKCVEIIKDQVKSRVPILMNLSCTSLKLALKLLKFGDDLGISGYVANIPQYFNLQNSEIKNYYMVLSKNCGVKPLFAYELSSTVPSTAALSYNLIIELTNENIINGIKYSGGDWDNYVMPLLDNLSDRSKFLFFIGSEIIVRKFSEANLKFDGGIFSGLNMFPSIYVDIYEAFQAENKERIADCLPYLMKVGAIFGAVYPSGAPSLMKETLIALGLPITNIVRSPLPSLKKLQYKKINKLIEELSNTEYIKKYK